MAQILTNATAADVARALCIVASRKVVYTQSVGDAAAPVWLVAGPHSQQIGVVADYRHYVEDAAERNGALLVTGWYDEDDGWVKGMVDQYADAVVEYLTAGGFRATARTAESEARKERARAIRFAREEAERPQREAAAREREAKAAANAVLVAVRREEYRPLYEAALARVRTNRHGKQHRGDLSKLQWAYDGTCEIGYDYDRAYALRHLTRYAEQGFTDAEHPALAE